MIETGDNSIFVVKEEGKIIGTLTLAFYRVPSGLKAWVEDVIVDESARGKGVATALIEHALQVAREIGALKFDLTSLPCCIAANRLYQKFGFENC